MTDIRVSLPAGVQSYLSGVQYPATRKDLLAAARQNNAPTDILLVLETLPEETFAEPGRAYGAPGAESPAPIPAKKMTVEEAGRKGGARTAETHGRRFYQEIGRKGGEARRGKLGSEGYRELGRKGGRASSHGRSVQPQSPISVGIGAEPGTPVVTSSDKTEGVARAHSDMEPSH